MRPIQLIAGLLLWSCWFPWGTLACRYNVLEVGFVDLDPEPYRLLGCVREETPADLILALKETSSAILADSNIRFEVVNLDQQKKHPAIQLLTVPPPGSFPAGVLVSPEGQSLPVALSIPGASGRPAMLAALRQIVSSPQREELGQKASRAFGVVLFIEGPQPQENRRARAAIARAIEQIKAQMKSMPKPISQPPVMMAIEAASFARERILLWSLGLAANPMKQAQAAVIYGRARWIGPVMKGEEITERNLAGILSIIGADCECGLDLSWTQGTRLPVRWDAKQQSEVTRRLGFDPESPLVKIEVSRILGRRGGSTAPSLGNESMPLESDPKSQGQMTASATTPNRVVPDTRPPQTPVWAQADEADEFSMRKNMWPLLTGTSTIIIAAGLWIVWRAGGKR